METWTSRAAGSSTCLTVSSCFPSRCLVPLLFRLSQFYLKNPLFRSSFNSCILSSQKLAAFHLGHFEVSCPCVAVHSPSSSPRTRFREASSPLTACVLQACFPTRLLCSPARHYDLLGGLIGDKSNSVVFDNSKLKKAVPGFAPSIRFEEGVERCIKYIFSHPECQVEDPEFDKWCDSIIEALDKAAENI